ncbi:MAG: hypothetical protein HYX63_01685 [Gammaproteobacteria bacterium]|nr:hypothetical protein [Gammaproteobacteria bacterium]
MKKVSKYSDPMTRIKPREPSLELADESPENDSKLVDKATAHLTALLSDPYYYEAYRRMKMHRDPALSVQRGVMKSSKGALARSLQSPKTVQSEKRSRPSFSSLMSPSRFSAFEHALEKIKIASPTLSEAELFRRLVKILNPNEPEDVHSQVATKLYQQVRNARKKYRTNRHKQNLVPKLK